MVFINFVTVGADNIHTREDDVLQCEAALFGILRCIAFFAIYNQADRITYCQ